MNEPGGASPGPRAKREYKSDSSERHDSRDGRRSGVKVPIAWRDCLENWCPMNYKGSTSSSRDNVNESRD